MIDGLLNENSEFEKMKMKLSDFNFQTLSHSLTPKKYYGVLHHSKRPGNNLFLGVPYVSDISYISRDMTVLVERVQITCSPPLSSLSRSELGHST